jgi:hypothetical protein
MNPSDPIFARNRPFWPDLTPSKGFSSCDKILQDNLSGEAPMVGKFTLGLAQC